MRAKKSHHLFSIILVLGLLVPAFSVQADTGAKATPANTLAVDPLKNNGSLIWNTFLGGYDPDEMIYDDDYGADVVVDAGGNVYITGTSSATWGAPVNPFSGGIDAFVAKLNNRGVLQWSTFLGGPDDDNNFIFY